MDTLLLAFDLVCASLEVLVTIGGPIAFVVLIATALSGGWS